MKQKLNSKTLQLSREQCAFSLDNMCTVFQLECWKNSFENLYGEISIRWIFLYAEISDGEVTVRRNFLLRNFFTAKFHYGKLSLRPNFLTAKFSTAKFPTAKFSTAKFPFEVCGGVCSRWDALMLRWTIVNSNEHGFISVDVNLVEFDIISIFRDVHPKKKRVQAMFKSINLYSQKHIQQISRLRFEKFI